MSAARGSARLHPSPAISPSPGPTARRPRRQCARATLPAMHAMRNARAMRNAGPLPDAERPAWGDLGGRLHERICKCIIAHLDSHPLPFAGAAARIVHALCTRCPAAVRVWCRPQPQPQLHNTEAWRGGGVALAPHHCACHPPDACITHATHHLPHLSLLTLLTLATLVTLVTTTEYVPYFLKLFVDAALLQLDARALRCMRPKRRVLLVRFLAKALLCPYYRCGVRPNV